MDPVGPVAPPRHAARDGADLALRHAARDLEASFLSAMLKEAGVGRLPGAFGGGAGEEQFTSFLREAYAKEIAAAGGIGLAERLFEVMRSRIDG
jgi:peptidoglycan hydrolase FlgJ